MRIYIGDSLNTLLHNALAEVHVQILGSSNTFFKHIVHQFALGNVIVPQVLKHPEDIDLHPRGGHSVVVILWRELMINDFA